jgi:vitamin B12 transporter
MLSRIQSRSLGLFCLAAAASPLSALAQTPQAAVELPDLVISANRIPTLAEQVASSVTVITADDIARKQLRTLSDALNLVPGISVAQSGGPGAASSVFMRGANSNHTKVLIDGIDVSDPSSPSGAFDFSQIQLADIARIEVLRGPQGALYGSDAIGGVINISTKKSESGSHVSVGAEIGSFGTFNQTASVGGGADRFNYDFSYNHLRVERTASVPPDQVAAGRPVHADSVDSQTFAARLGYKLTDTVEAGLVVRYVESLLKFTEDDYIGPEGVRSDQRNRQWFTRATLHQTGDDGRFDQTLGLGFTRYDRGIADPGPNASAPFSLYQGQRAKLDWQGNYRVIEGETVTLGAETSREQYANNNPSRGHQTDNAGLLQLQSNIGDRFFNTASVRVDDYQSFGTHPTWRLAPAYLLPGTGTKLRASVGTAFKAPSLDDLFDNYPNYGGGFFANPKLKPETSAGFDIGIDQKLADDALKLSATFFHNDIRNLIDYNSTYTSVINVGRASTQGIEAGIDWTISQRLSTAANYTYTEAEDEAAHVELRRRPKHKVNLGAQAQVTDRLSLSATAIYVGSWVDAARNYNPGHLYSGGYATANLAANYQLGHGLELFGRVDNLLDRKYQDPVGFLHPGLGVYAGLRASLDGKQLGLWQ